MAGKNSVPDWLVKKVGIIDTVPKPWTRVRIAGDTLSCWGRDHVFDGRPFPSQIVSRGEGLLAAPMRLRLETGGKTREWRRCTVSVLDTDANGRTARREAAGKLDDLFMRCSTELHYDGAMRITLRLDPCRPVPISALTLEIPMKKSQATLGWALFGPHCHPSVKGFAVKDLPDEGCAGPFDPPLLWLGNEERGLGWTADSNQGWDPGDDAMALQVRQREVLLSLRMIRQERTLERPLSLTFMLQANPWKPAARDADRFNIYHYHSLYDYSAKDLKDLRDQGVRTLIYHSLWSHLHAYPETAYEKKLKRLVRDAHKVGLKLLVYFGSEFSHGAREWPAWGERWAIADPNRGYIPSRGPQFKAPHVCSNTEWPDFVLGGIEKLLRKYDLDGVYLDGWGDCWGRPCENGLHGCGYRREDGTWHGTYDVWARRSLIERLYAIVHAHKPDGRIDMHANPGPAIMTAPFADSCFGGEGYQGNYHLVDLAAFRAMHMGLEQFGVASDLIATADVEFGIAMGLLHNVLPRTGAYELGHKTTLRQQARVWRTRKAFNVRKADWLPYWRNRGVVRVSPAPVKASLWNRPGEGVLLVVSNLGKEDARARVRLNGKSLRLKGRLDCLDLLPAGEAPSVAGTTLTMPVPGGSCRLLFVAPAGSKLWPTMRRCHRWVQQKSDSYVKFDEWLVVGPFGDPKAGLPEGHSGTVEVADDFRGLETQYPPEAGPVEVEGEYRTALGRRSWQRAMAEDGLMSIPLDTVRETWDVIYCYTRIHFPTLVPSYPDNPVELRLRTENAYALWVNGEKLHTYGGAGVYRYGIRSRVARGIEDDVVPAVLHPGWNTLLVKLVARRGSALQLRITGPDDSKLPPLLIQATDKE